MGKKTEMIIIKMKNNNWKQDSYQIGRPSNSGKNKTRRQ